MNTKPLREPASRPGEPTDASPGSNRKIRVLMERAARRESLFHPNDNLKRKFAIAPNEPDADAEVALEQDLLLDEEEEIEMEIDLAG